jgi:hypothetical protein
MVVPPTALELRTPNYWVLCVAPRNYCYPRTYIKGGLYTSALNYFGMLVMTLHYRQHLKLAPVS